MSNSPKIRASKIHAVNITPEEEKKIEEQAAAPEVLYEITVILGRDKGGECVMVRDHGIHPLLGIKMLNEVIRRYASELEQALVAARARATTEQLATMDAEVTKPA